MSIPTNKDSRVSALATDWQQLLPHSEVVAELAEYMVRAPELRARRLRAFAIADELKLSRNAVLCAFLSLTKAGYYDLNWAILCPSCRGSGPGVKHLTGVTRDEHCEGCRIRFDAQFDENVEVTFQPTAKLRALDETAATEQIDLGLDPTQPVVTAHYVTTLQDFRDLFGSEVLRPGLELSIANVVLLFSDLKDSTLLYETRGDAPAFSLVQDHFNIMIAAIRECGGGVVKTIGDAIMAVFTSEAAALRAALKILEAFEDWNATHPPEQAIIIKLGLHMGPCIALELNDKLDYFGSTVNKAARVQGASTGSDLVVSERIYKSPAIAALKSAASRLAVSEFTAELKGIAGKSTLYRLTLTPRGERALR
jgi:class 3 adenylate cyclase